jgi:hypothetical protein
LKLYWHENGRLLAKIKVKNSGKERQPERSGAANKNNIRMKMKRKGST